MLTQCLADQPKSSASSKADLETRTSAVNISPSKEGQYDIGQIKEDSLWLSKLVDVDEITALRVAVLEWQLRPARSLQSRSGDLPLSASSTSILDAEDFPAGTISNQDKDGEANKDRVRRRTILQILLAERRYLIKVAEYLATGSLCAEDNHSITDTTPYISRWISDLGHTLITKWNIDGVSEAYSRVLFIAGIEALRTRLVRMEGGCDWVEDSKTREGLEVLWQETQLLEFIHILQLLLVITQVSVRLTRTDVMLAWFRFMAEHSFFEDFEHPLEAYRTSFQTPLQSLIALVSVSVLGIARSIEGLQGLSGMAIEGADKNDVPYLLNPNCVTEVNELLIQAAEKVLRNASVAVFAWSIISQTIQLITNDIREGRETQQSQRLLDRYGTTDPSEITQSDRPPSRIHSSADRRSSAGSDLSNNTTLIEEHLDRIKSVAVDGDPITFLARSSVDGSHVLELIATLASTYANTLGHEHTGLVGMKIRVILMDVLRAALDIVPYQPQLLLAILAVLTGPDTPAYPLQPNHPSPGIDPASVFLQDDDILLPKLYIVALERFPYETIPFLRICQALSNVTANASGEIADPALRNRIQALESYTCIMPSDFNHYSTIQEEEDANLISLTSELQDTIEGISSRSSKLLKSSKLSTVYRKSAALVTLPAGTVGRVLSESRPFVVKWRYDFSLLELLGRYLQLASAGSSIRSTSVDYLRLREVVPEAISLITTLICTAQRGAAERISGIQSAKTILEEASNALDRNEDIISIICSVFEDELYRRRTPGEGEDSINILVGCARFLTAALPISPDRIWSFLGRSSLLGAKDGRSQLSAIITINETVLGRYDFLIACLDLYAALLEDFRTHCLSRGSSSKAVTRFGRMETPKPGISETLIQVIFQTFSRIVVDVMHNMEHWRFAATEQRLELGLRIFNTLHTVMSFFYAVSDDAQLSQKIRNPILPAVQEIRAKFVGDSVPGGWISYTVEIFASGLVIPESSLSQRGIRTWYDQIISAMTFITFLIHISLTGNINCSELSDAVVKAIPKIVRLYTKHESFERPVADLIAAAMKLTEGESGKGRALIAAMSKEEAKAFLQVLAAEDRPLQNLSVCTSVWTLLTIVLQGNQQWFASMMLVGKPPGSSKRQGDPTTQSVEPLLGMALDSLSHISNLEYPRASAMLQFVVAAAEYWPSANAIIGAHPDFLTAISVYLQGLDYDPHSNPRAAAVDYEKPNLAASCFELLSLHVQHLRSSSNDARQLSKKLAEAIQPLTSKAISKPIYNTSLHQNLQQNFESRFAPYSLSDFRRNSPIPPVLGDRFYYDIDFMETVLNFDSSWYGTRDEGFKGEVQRANVNLSAVESQIHLFHSWKSLSITLSETLDQDSDFQTAMISMIKSCLTCNAQNDLPQPIFERLCQSRADMALLLLQRLTTAEFGRTSNFLDILPVAWDTLRQYDSNIDTALSGSGATYYRTLLRTLYLSLQAHTTSTPPTSTPEMKTNPYTSTIISLITDLIAPSFRSLTTLLHTTSDIVHPADFSLLTALLRSALHTPQIDRHLSTILTAFATNQTGHCAATLLSWADQLATDNDPVYGELSLGFLVEMSNLPVLAESLATEGILAQIVGTNLFQYFRDAAGGISPFDGNYPPRIYTIWSKGFLPLCLNLLYAVGAPIAAEIAGVLNTFPAQLQRESEAFSSSSSMPPRSSSSSRKNPSLEPITLSTCSSTLTLSLLTHLLLIFRNAGSSAGINPNDIPFPIPLPAWNYKQVLEDVRDLLAVERKGELRERVVPSGGGGGIEEDWWREDGGKEGGGCESLLEEKVRGVLGEVRGVLEGLGGLEG